MTSSEQQLIEALIGESLLDASAAASERASDNGHPHTSVLEHCISRGLASRDRVVPFLKKRAAFLTLGELNPEPDAIAQVPIKYALFYSLLPLKLDGDTLHCALANPFDASLRQEIETILGTSIDAVWAFSSDIQEAIKRFYGLGAALSPGTGMNQAAGPESAEVAVQAGYAVKSVEELLLDAQDKRATDIHLEPFGDRLRVRYRIDGLLYEQHVTDQFMQNRDSIVARLKVLASLNLADRRKPQDGRIKTLIGGHEFDLRISILPTESGESVGVRLLSENRINVGLQELGFSEHDLSAVESALACRHGIILVTGPTGSGKTTTLYNFLGRLNDPGRKIITIEDPIEYQLDGITQLQVKPQINFTFANGLRSMLRHDPDVMMVGEIRDPDTAAIAIQVALTGHLVLSTVHTNDSVSTLTRLMDMGVEPYLLTATLECIMAQRLVRRICPDCITGEPHDVPDLSFKTYVGAGCSRCNNTGYFGRVAVFEIFRLNGELKEMIGQSRPIAEIKAKALASGLKGLYAGALEKVQRGVTTYGEVKRVLEVGA